jgi:nucleotide-binding universal stress UspA family protein
MNDLGHMAIPPYVIVASVDRSEYSEAVITNAFDEATRHERAIVHFLTIVEKGDTGEGKRISDESLAHIDVQLRELVGEVFSAFADAIDPEKNLIRAHVRTGEAVREIIELAQEVRADRIFVGAHGSSGKKRKHGGVPSQMLEEAPCTVVVVRAKELREHAGTEECEACIFARADSGGEQWFCEEHRGKQIPRLVGRAGSTGYKSGWGLF